jgi:membrane-bound serine protease (ClpP class)
VVLILAILAAFFLLPAPWGIGVVLAAACFEFVELAIWRRTLNWGKKTGPEALVGTSVEVVEDCAPRGRVRLRGEFWNAVSEVPLHAGERAVVRSVDGLSLELEPETEKGP